MPYWFVKSMVGDTYIQCKVKAFDEEDTPCTINSLLYLVSCEQYVITCMCFSVSKPFRKAIWTNPLYLVSLLAMIVYQTILLFRYDKWSEETFGLVEFPMHYRKFLLGIVVANLVLTFMFERYFIGWFNRYWNKRKELQKAATRQQNINKVFENKNLFSPMASPVSSNYRDL